MIFFEMKLDNFFQFKDFTLDLTIPRVSKYSPIIQEHKIYPNIKYKKFGVLLGANASGKTTLGKAICTIENFLGGRKIDDLGFVNIIDMLSTKYNKNMKWDITFCLGNYMYNNKVEITKKGIVKESWSRIVLKNLYYRRLKEELDNTKEKLYYEDYENPKFTSYFLNAERYSEFANEIVGKLGYLFSFSGDAIGMANDFNDVDSKLITDIMTTFDSSIKSVYNSDDIKGNKVIEFNNGYKEIILKNGKLASGDFSVLSTGTKESIYLSYLIAGMIDRHRQTYYVDERMSHSHSEIEQQVIQILISLIDKIDGQVFITSHNSDLLDMSIPNYNFMLLKKNKDGSITDIIQPEKYVKHNDRSLRNIIEQDIFSTAPGLDKLLNLHESIIGD